jgi:hypothetical protein
MKKRMKVSEMISALRSEKIRTWFDLGIFIDRFRETKPLPTVRFSGTYKDFKKRITEGGMAFITFLYSVDGVTIEVEKYAKIFRKILKGIKIHYICGRFYPESYKLIDKTTIRYEIPEMRAFDNWKLYRDFYFTKLERGGRKYNELIIKFWEEVLIITEKLGTYIENNNINILYLINVCSNPGNISMALATIFVAEYMGIPVINNNHDFYWEGGNKRIDILEKGLKEGPRDFFFNNADIGEVFSVIEVLFPWESRSWINVNINQMQSRRLIVEKGHNPASVTEIGTAVDTNKYFNVSKREKINTFYQFEKILSRYSSALISYSVSDVIKNNLVDKKDPRPILIGAKTRPVEKFLSENIIFLQPTRIIARKRIELGFKLIKRLFNNVNFVDRLKTTPNLKLTVIVTGPIAVGHFEYYQKLIIRFSELLNVIDPGLRNKVYLAFLFSELDKESFKSRFSNPVGVPELYNIASLVLLPSRTEGRGLPIIESTACGTPIFCRRYFPKNVYSEVIGEHLPEIDRLKVIEFSGKKITSKHADDVFDRVMFPHKYTEEILHNKNAILGRFSLEALTNNINNILFRLYNQILPNERSFEIVRAEINKYKKVVNFSNDDLRAILNTENRHFMPGFGRLAFMLNLKSLIDPSAFRVEEQQIRGFVHSYANKLLKDYSSINIPEEKKYRYFNAVDNIFHYREGEIKIRHDHSFAYRHRNKNYYPYQDFTIQELSGLVNLLFLKIVNPRARKIVDESPHFFTDWNLALAELTSSSDIAIDDRERLIKKLQTNIPIGVFPGDYVKYELEFFALQSVRSRLRLTIEEELDSKLILKNKNRLAPVYVFAHTKPIGKWYNKDDIIEYIESGKEKELYLLYKYGLIKIIDSKQLCLGIHFPQMGAKALKVLRYIRDNGGFLISNRQFASIMSDIVDIDCFHIGNAIHPITANIMGIQPGSGYIQFVPAGIRTTLAYPTPIQTAKDFNQIINSRQFNNAIKKYGEEKLFQILKRDSEERGSPADYVLDNLMGAAEKNSEIEYEYLSGIYSDGMPWNGVYAKVNVSNPDYSWVFRTMSSINGTKKVTTLAEEFSSETGKDIKIAWNGGYILNPELVGKLGLPESYIGSPLGLLVSDKKITSPPLYNKAAFLVSNEGKIDIRRVNSKKGITVTRKKTKIIIDSENYNCERPGTEPCYYDLLYKHEDINAKGRVIVRLSGNIIKDIIKNSNLVKIIPVGLTLSFPAERFPEDFDELEAELGLKVNGISNIIHAVEAGPLIVNNGEVAINMEEGGWTTANSIATQAARLDYTDMRGPKIAAGIDREGNLLVLTVNGRIRESVGATHVDMAEIMIKLGARKAMGFDPGGSSTLVAGGKVLNISPYNSEYEKNIYSMPPEPRAVSNAVLGYTDDAVII